MNTKSIFAATAIALAAASAQAAPVIVLDLADGSASFSSALAEQEYQFELPSASVGNGTVTATFGANSGYVISGITFNGTTLTPDVNTAHFTNYTLFDGPLAAGVYSFTVTGASKGGEYVGRVDVSAVPEPASMAMLLAGMGALGIILNGRRRRS